jgi:hypothetical protein
MNQDGVCCICEKKSTRRTRRFMQRMQNYLNENLKNIDQYDGNLEIYLDAIPQTNTSTTINEYIPTQIGKKIK